MAIQSNLNPIEYLAIEAQVGLVDAVAAHGVGVAHLRERRRARRSTRLRRPRILQQTLDQSLDALPGRERHLDVHLQRSASVCSAQSLASPARSISRVAVYRFPIYCIDTWHQNRWPLNHQLECALKKTQLQSSNIVLKRQ